MPWELKTGTIHSIIRMDGWLCQPWLTLWVLLGHQRAPGEVGDGENKIPQAPAADRGTPHSFYPNPQGRSSSEEDSVMFLSPGHGQAELHTACPWLQQALRLSRDTYKRIRKRSRGA